MTALLTGTTDRIGLWAAFFLEQVRGFTGIADFTVMSITGMTLITVTLDQCPSAGRSASTTSRETRRGTGEAMWATLAMKRGVNTPSQDIAVVAMRVVGMAAAATTKAQAGLRNSVETIRV